MGHVDEPMRGRAAQARVQEPHPAGRREILLRAGHGALLTYIAGKLPKEAI